MRTVRERLLDLARGHGGVQLALDRLLQGVRVDLDVARVHREVSLRVHPEARAANLIGSRDGLRGQGALDTRIVMVGMIAPWFPTVVSPTTSPTKRLSMIERPM